MSAFASRKVAHGAHDLGSPRSLDEIASLPNFAGQGYPWRARIALHGRRRPAKLIDASGRLRA
jgi:hypothetical protein